MGKVMMSNKKISRSFVQNKYVYALYLSIFSIILTPSIKIGNLPAIRLEQIIVILFFLYKLINLGKMRKIKKHNNMFPIVFSFFSFIIVLSILAGAIKGVQVTANDLFEIYKILIYIGLYLITISAVNSQHQKSKVLNFLMICLFLSILISVQQYFNLFDLNEKYVKLIAPTQYRSLVDDYPYPRVIGMTSNPNEYAVMPGIGAIISWSIFFLTRKKKYLFYTAACVFGILMTRSRSGFVFAATGIVIVTSIFLFKSISKGKINSKIFNSLISSIIILLFFGIIIFNFLPNNLTSRLKSGLDIKTDRSFQARLINWNEHINYFKSSPLLGLGPAKSIEYRSHVDNEWLLFLKRYGIIGCSYIVFAFTFPFARAKDKFYKYIYFSTLLASAIYMIPAIIYHSFQIMPLIIILAGLTQSNNRTDIHLGSF